MRIALLLAGALALAACGNRDAEKTATMNEPAAGATAAGNMATANPALAASAGTYEMRAAGGQAMTQTLRPDGTFTTMTNGQQTAAGTWRVNGQQICTTPQGATETCLTGGAVGADGTFTATSTPGNQQYTVRKIAAAN